MKTFNIISLFILISTSYVMGQSAYKLDIDNLYLKDEITEMNRLWNFIAEGLVNKMHIGAFEDSRVKPFFDKTISLKNKKDSLDDYIDNLQISLYAGLDSIKNNHSDSIVLISKKFAQNFVNERRIDTSLKQMINQFEIEAINCGTNNKQSLEAIAYYLNTREYLVDNRNLKWEDIYFKDVDINSLIFKLELTRSKVLMAYNMSLLYFVDVCALK